MIMTPAQEGSFKTWLLANAVGLSDPDAATLANALVSPAYFVWQTNAVKSAIEATIIKANFTPNDTPPAGTAVPLVGTDLAYSNRAFAAQLKQFNAQWLTMGSGGIDARIVQVRQNFKDCLTQLPTGTAGANVDAGWGTVGTPGAVRLALIRQATTFEALFTTVGSGAGNDGTAARGLNTNPDLIVAGADGQPLEGLVTSGQVAETRGSG